MKKLLLIILFCSQLGHAQRLYYNGIPRLVGYADSLSWYKDFTMRSNKILDVGQVRFGATSATVLKAIDFANRNSGDGSTYWMHMDAYNAWAEDGTLNAKRAVLRPTSSYPPLSLAPYGTSAGETGAMVSLELAANGIQFTGFKAPDALAYSIIYSMPNDTATIGYVLTRGAGNQLSWTNGGAGAGETNTASNAAGLGIGVFRSKVGVDLVFKRLKAGFGISLADSTDSIMVRTDTSAIPVKASPYFTGNMRIWAGNLGIRTDPATNTAIHTLDQLSQSEWRQDNYGGLPSISFRHTNGNLAAPSAAAADDPLGDIQWKARDNSDFSANPNARILAVATQNFTTTAHGTKLTFYTTHNNATSPTLAATIDSAQKLILVNPLALTSGGTGLSAGGSSNQFLATNSAGNASEYKSITAGGGISLTHSVGGLAVAAKSDTLSKANVFTAVAATDTLFLFKVDQSGLTARQIYSKRKGGTSASLNVIRVRAGSASTLRSSAIATASAAGFLTPMESWSTLQNTTTLIDDEFYLVITAISGTATDITTQITFDRTMP